MTGRRFAYWREPLCLLAAALYACNSVWWKPCTADPTSFVHCYLSDVLCLPVLLPVALWLQRGLRLRAHDGAPTVGEWLGHWALWSLSFEVLGPAAPALAPGAVSDPWDVVAYGCGGIVAAWCWRVSHRERSAPSGAATAIVRRVAQSALAVAVSIGVLSAYHVEIALR
ncbi:MAG: hypothetical protein VYA51_02545 [Planctomycetota bacterium]|nr:hypothetical protein [Planctomycetota bacterium]MEC9046865.1 hypothetical protein [Planctomycetota bacterium]